MHYRVRPREADVLQPDEYHARFTDTAFGRMRSRSLGTEHAGVPPVVTLQGMAVSDYLLPALAVLGGWTRTHLVDLPGLAGSGPATAWLDVPGYAAAVTAWLDDVELPPVVLIGRSSSTQVAAHIAANRPDLVHVLVLASPTVDPAARSWPRLLLRWRWDSRYPLPGLQQHHVPEWVRAGLRQLRHLVAVHLHDHLNDTITFGTRPARDKLLDYLGADAPFDEIDLGLFSHGTNSIGLAGPGEWDEVLRRARRRGAYCGIDRDRFPQDFASNLRFHDGLSRREGSPAPYPAPWTWVRERMRELQHSGVSYG